MPSRQLHVTVPLEYEQYVVDALEDVRDAHNVASFPGRSAALIICRTRDKHAGRVIHALERIGVGHRFGTIDVLTLQMSKPRVGLAHGEGQQRESKKRYRAADRMTTEEIYEFVDSQSHLTFDYLALTSAAAIIAAVGLLTNSSVLVVASMLVAPLMGPILGTTFGAVVHDRVLVWKGLRNEVVGILLTFGWGCFCAIAVAYTETIEDWTTYQMTQRGTYGSLLAGVAVAIPSGVGVAIAATSGGFSALVGVAISASLLPPIVNSGVALTFGLVEHSRTGETHHLQIAMISFTLFLINWLFIFMFAVIVFYIKRVRPLKGHTPDLFRSTSVPGRYATFSREVTNDSVYNGEDAASSLNTDDLMSNDGTGVSPRRLRPAPAVGDLNGGGESAAGAGDPRQPLLANDL